MRCAIYVRVSTDEQARSGYSLAAQVDRIEFFIKSQGWAAAEKYSDDGYSAKDRKRPALKRLIDDASKKRFAAVLVYKIDRLSRSLKDLIEIVEELSRFGVAFKSITEHIDTTTPEGRLMFHQFGSFAQYERELIGQRTRMGMIKRLKEGKWNGGPAPFGYRVKDGTLKVKDKEAKTVRLIYELSDKRREGVIDIARYLNDRKIRGIRGKWRQNTVHRILTSPVYCGELNWGGERIENSHKAIIKRALFDKIRQDLKERKAKTKDINSPNLLTGLIFCKCGSAMHVVYPGPPKSHYKYYVCTSRITYKNCRTDYIRTEILEKCVIAQVRKFYSDENLFSDVVKKMRERFLAELPGIMKRKSHLTDRIRRLSRHKENLLKWMGEVEVKPYTLNAINEKLEKIEPELNAAHYELMRIEEILDKKASPACSSKKIAGDVARSLESFQHYSFAEQKELLGDVIHRIQVYSRDAIHLYFRPPPQIPTLSFWALSASRPEQHEFMGAAAPNSSTAKNKTQNAVIDFYRTTFSLTEYTKGDRGDKCKFQQRVPARRKWRYIAEKYHGS